MNQHRLAILGAAGIGMAHLHAALKLGCPAGAILSRSAASGAATQAQIKAVTGVDVAVYTSLVDLIADFRPSAVIIATPAERHLADMRLLAAHSIPFICEKPLIAINELTVADAEAELLNLASVIPAASFLNVSNSYFVRYLAPLPATPRQVAFHFYSNGPYRYQDIAWDMLPHGLSILQALGISGEISHLQQQIDCESYQSWFEVADTQVQFVFKESATLSKYLAIAVDGQRWERVQEGFRETYRVYLANPNTGKMAVPDPFVSCVADFLQGLSVPAAANANTETVCARPIDNMRYVLEYAKTAGLLQ